MNDNGYIAYESIPYDDEGFNSELSKVVKVLKNAQTSYGVAQEMLEEMNQRSSDLLHYIELHPNLNAAEGYKVYSKLTEIRRKRRELKNQIMYLEPICSFVEKQTAVPDVLGALLGQCRKVIKDQKDFVYRIRTDELSTLPGGDG